MERALNCIEGRILPRRHRLGRVGGVAAAPDSPDEALTLGAATSRMTGCALFERITPGVG